MLTAAPLLALWPLRWSVHFQYPFRYEEVDIGLPQHSAWLDQYTNDIPVVHVEGREIARHRLNESTLTQSLESAGCKAKQE